MARRWLTSAALLLSIGCSPDAKIGTEPAAPRRTARDFTRLASILAGLKKPAEIRLCEGLPGEFWEPELREQELARKATIRLHDYPFYEEQLTLQDRDSEDLAGRLSSRGSYKPHRDRKGCGPYHPDHGVIWKSGEGTTEILISLECGEVEMFGPQAELHCDLAPEAARAIGSILARYRKNRPAPEPAP